MKKNKLCILLSIIALICFFGTAAICNQCAADTVEDVEGTEEEEAAAEEAVEGEGSETPESEEEESAEGEENVEEEEASEEEEETPEQEEQKEAPTITLEIYEGPIYSSSDNVCYYRIKANVTGTPSPDVEFSKDDAGGAWGEFKCQINLNNPTDTYTLKATATNSEGSDNDAIDLTWGCTSTNSPPEITEIIFPVGDLRVGLNYHILANATDPDGDALTYTWSVSDGIINPPLGNPLIWTTPDFDGNYEITLVVDDGNGGTDTKTESVTVYPLPPSQQSMEVPIDEAGNIIKDNITNTAPAAPIVVGDAFFNEPFRGFVSFDIRDLAGTTINNATLMFTNSSQHDDPYNQLIEAFWVKVVNWGDDALELGDFDLPSSPLGEYPDPNITISNQALKDALQIAINNGSNRFQIMISHKGWQTNHNNDSDYIRYFREYIHLNVDFTGP